MHYIGKVEFYRHVNLQVETRNYLGATKMTNTVMNSNMFVLVE